MNLIGLLIAAFIILIVCFILWQARAEGYWGRPWWRRRWGWRPWGRYWGWRRPWWNWRYAQYPWLFDSEYNL